MCVHRLKHTAKLCQDSLLLRYWFFFTGDHNSTNRIVLVTLSVTTKLHLWQISAAGKTKIYY